jgi:hypothetical protein
MSLPLEDAMRQCNRHVQRMVHAMERIGFPLTAERLGSDDDSLVTLLDQFVFRYTKLQDTMGEQVLRLFCSQVLLEPVEDAVLANVLALLERRGYLSESQWREQRAMRNALTHEYPEQVGWQVQTLNLAHGLAQQLVAWFERLQAEFNTSKLA